MIIHHGDHSKMVVEHLKGTVLGKSGRLYLLYETEKGNRAIVEYSLEDTAKIFQTRLSIQRVEDSKLWEMF